jgi:hypothetical protein
MVHIKQCECQTLMQLLPYEKIIVCTNSRNTIAKHQAPQVWNHMELHRMLKVVIRLE